MVSSGKNLQKHILLGILVVCVSQTVFGQLVQDILEGPATTCRFLRQYDYDCERHKVTTSDGYILNMFRVLCPNKKVSNTTSRPVAFLMHGLLCSSSLWTISPENSLAMTMCDSGYDVWLGNARGNQYSKEHATFSTLSPNFYKFSWSEIASIDLPTMLNYTLRLTGQTTLIYVGHSQGTTAFFALASRNPTMTASIISSAHLLSPVVFTDDWQGALPALSEPIFGRPDPTSNVIEIEFLPKTVISDILGIAACEDTDVTQGLCEDVIKTLFGVSELTNTTVIPDFLKTFPAGSSLRQYKHYIQEKRSGNFALYDFGTVLNLQKYGTLHPPEYQLENVNLPSFLYYSDKDFLCTPSAVQKLAARLNSNTIRGIHFFPGYNHFDFIYANNVKQELHTQILENINSI